MTLPRNLFKGITLFKKNLLKERKTEYPNIKIFYSSFTYSYRDIILSKMYQDIGYIAILNSIILILLFTVPSIIFSIIFDFYYILMIIFIPFGIILIQHTVRKSNLNVAYINCVHKYRIEAIEEGFLVYQPRFLNHPTLIKFNNIKKIKRFYPKIEWWEINNDPFPLSILFLKKNRNKKKKMNQYRKKKGLLYSLNGHGPNLFKIEFYKPVNIFISPKKFYKHTSVVIDVDNMNSLKKIIFKKEN